MGTLIRIEDKWETLIWLREDISYYRDIGNKPKELKFTKAYKDILQQLTN